MQQRTRRGSGQVSQADSAVVGEQRAQVVAVQLAEVGVEQAFIARRHRRQVGEQLLPGEAVIVAAHEVDVVEMLHAQPVQVVVGDLLDLQRQDFAAHAFGVIDLFLDLLRRRRRG